MSGLFEAAIGAIAGHLVGEKVKEAVGKGKEKISTPKGEVSEKKSGNSIFDWLKEKAGFKDEAEKIQEDAQKERAGIFRSVAGSVAERYCPTLMKMWDAGRTLASTVGISERGAEIHPLQHEIESITALSLFVPDFMLKHLTEPLRKSETFQKIVEKWPLLNQDWIDKMKQDDCDPDNVISVLRIMNQDIVAGKATFDKVTGFFISGKKEKQDVSETVPKNKPQAKATPVAANDVKADAPAETREAA